MANICYTCITFYSTSFEDIREVYNYISHRKYECASDAKYNNFSCTVLLNSKKNLLNKSINKNAIIQNYYAINIEIQTKWIFDKNIAEFLKRNIPNGGDLDYIYYSYEPQMHYFKKYDPNDLLYKSLCYCVCNTIDADNNVIDSSNAILKDLESLVSWTHRKYVKPSCSLSISDAIVRFLDDEKLSTLNPKSEITVDGKILLKHELFIHKFKQI